MAGAFATWSVFQKQRARSWWRRLGWLRRGVYLGEGARLPGSGLLMLEPTCSVQRFAVLNALPDARLRIGKGTRIGAFAVLSAAQSIDIGEDVLIADRVFITDHQHGSSDWAVPVIRQGVEGIAPVSVGPGCWLGINVCVMPGVTLGRNCIVGAGAVVTRSFAEGSIIAGVPARLIGERART